MEKKYVAYLRISKEKNREDNELSERGQLAAITRFVESRAGEILQVFTEVESGKNDKRPQLALAMAMAKSKGATLVIHKLDRLSRHAAFIMALRDSGIDFVVADMPDANTMTIGLLAVLAQHEREQVSERTKSALRAKMATGWVAGQPWCFEVLQDWRTGLKFREKDGIVETKPIEGRGEWSPASPEMETLYRNRHPFRMTNGRMRGANTMIEKAKSNPANTMAAAHAKLLKEKGLTLQQIADELNKAGYTTPRGFKFSYGSIPQILKYA